MVDVCIVYGLITIERTVRIDQIDNRDVTSPVGGGELIVCILEYRDNNSILVYKQADIVFLDASAKTDGDSGETVFFIFLHQVLNFRHVSLAMGTLGAEIVNQQGTVGKMTKENAWIANSY